MKIYLEEDGVKYYDYDLILDSPINDPEKYTAAFGMEVMKLFDEDIDSLLDQNYTPQTGSEIHVVPQCIYAMDDIRNNYTIKRNVDSGCCNVFSPWPWNRRCANLWLYAYAIFPHEKLVMGITTRSYNKDYGTKLHSLTLNIGNASDKDVKFFYPYKKDKQRRLILSPIPVAYTMLLKGELKTPAISYKKLKFENANELTMDMLQLIYNTGKIKFPNQKDRENYVIQLNALNQHNWREYPVTMTILFRYLLWKDRTSTAFDIKSSTSRQSKVVKEICNFQTTTEFKSKKDFDMAKQLVENFVQIGNAQFTTASTLVKKLDGAGIPLEIFELFYGNIVKLIPTTYAE